MKKRVIAMLFVLTLAVTLVCGCGSEPKENGDVQSAGGRKSQMTNQRRVTTKERSRNLPGLSLFLALT